MARELKKSKGITMQEAEFELARDGGLGSRLHQLAFGSFADFDATEHLLRIEKSNPVSLDKLGALIEKEA